jgi:hypothetical protein
MKNDINYRQNQENSINMIAAFRQVYSDVKCFSMIQVALSVWVPIGLTLVTLMLKNQSLTTKLGFGAIDISLPVSFYCVVIAFADLFLFTKFIDRGKDIAAKIQERFDISVFGLPWNATLVGAKTDMEDIYSLHRKFFQSTDNKKDDLVNWYNPKVSTISHNKGVLLCQRMNLYWDKSLRESVNDKVFHALLIWCLLIFGVALFQDLSINTFFLTVICPLLPIFSYAIKLIKDNQASIATLTRLKSILDTAWNDATNNMLTLEKLREVQNEIYQHRKTNRPISNRFYWKLKNEYEKSAQYSIEQMIMDLDVQEPMV